MTAWPPITITQNTDGTVTITSAGITQAQLPPAPNVHRQAMNIAASIAKHYGRTLPVTATGPDGTYHMSIHPNGDIDTHQTPPSQTDNTQTPNTDNASNDGNDGIAIVASNPSHARNTSDTSDLEQDDLDQTQRLPQTLHKQASLPPQAPPQPTILEEADNQEPQNTSEKTPAEEAKEEVDPAAQTPGESKNQPRQSKRLKLILSILIILIALAAIFSVRGLQPGNERPNQPTTQATTQATTEVTTQATTEATTEATTKETEQPTQAEPQPDPQPAPAPAPEPQPAPAPAPAPQPAPAPAPAPAGVTSMNTSVNTNGGGAAHFAISLSGSGSTTCSINIGGRGSAASTSIPGTAYATVTGIPLGTQSWTTSCDGLTNSGTITIY